ncbi:ABC transporter ATP-binding protein [Gryllotalpicola ginsengisoli]|uniref:ABC transporter ATP-binding protein n=1 Tax=Gryllotalpicola ginsengisoli TaxID=444608 RepID=UPI003898E2D1
MSTGTVTDASPIVAEPIRPGVPKVDPILIADGVVRHFGGNVAVDVAHVEVPRGKITALIGPNGAGKTTFFNLLTGFDKPNSGAWTFQGHSLAGVPPHKVARRGMVRTFQLTKSLGLLSVLENMRLGATKQLGERFIPSLMPFLWSAQEKAITEKAMELLARFKLDAKADDYAASLSGGQRKLLEMARALMSDPTLVMLDEPMAGVNPALTQSLLGHILNLKREGMTVLFVEHDMHMVQTIADWVIVMAEGKVVAEGYPREVMGDPAVIDAYLGAHHDTDLGTLTGQLAVAEEVGVSGDLIEQIEGEIEAEPNLAAEPANESAVELEEEEAPGGASVDEPEEGEK